VIEFFDQIIRHYPNVHSVVLILDNVPYFKAKIVREWLDRNPELICWFLPTYSPNLNLIERFWRLTKEQLVNSIYYKQYKTFRCNVFRFLNHIDKYKDRLKSLMNEKFQILNKNRRREITQTGTKIFSDKGYHQTRIQDITTALDISTGTFYAYFKNKKELFVEVVNEVVRTILGEAAVAIKQEQDFISRLLVRGRVFYENYTRYQEILSLLRAEMASEEKWALKKVTKIYQKLTQPLVREIQQAIDQGIIREVDQELLAYSMTGLIEILSLRTKMDGKYHYDHVINFVQDLVENGININNIS